ncbi:MAG: SDR family oxidoreductase [Candidatus Omnitrophota bacterium]
MELKDKVVVITGASSGIGRSLAVKLFDAGCYIALASRDENKLKELTGQLGGDSKRCLVLPTDVSDKSQVDNMIDKALEVFKKIDILINCAGLGIYGKVASSDIEQIRYIFEVNFFGTVYAIQKAYPIMSKAEGGCIVNISSVAGFRAWPNNGYYCAAKHAVNAITDSLRLEAKSDNIDVLLVMPGTTNTDFISNSLNVAEEVKKSPPMDMTPDEVARHVIDAIRKRKNRIVLTAKGKIIYILNRISPSLTERLLSSGT